MGQHGEPEQNSRERRHPRHDASDQASHNRRDRAVPRAIQPENEAHHPALHRAPQAERAMPTKLLARLLGVSAGAGAVSVQRSTYNESALTRD